MPNCQSIDPFVTAYVDGELPGGDRDLVQRHLQVCGACRSRIVAEQAVRALIQDRKPSLKRDCASPALRAKCARSAALLDARSPAPAAAASRWRARLAPYAVAASLVLVVGGAFLYQLTDRSARVLAAELTADHMKCFALTSVFGSRGATAPRVERAMIDGFGWPLRLPANPERAGLELVGARPCLYAEGRVAHIMYRHRGEPVSVFMLPNTVRPETLTSVLGHECAIWSSGDRTFVLIAREPRGDVERMAAFVQASLH
jgi:anti-sigma factor RsiW